ncbi:MAG: gamma-glutamyl-gamma-aminobutyrate hydrolase family protein [bacterium]|nr:gamma-glutamyl-gamma-aminobutyrate hydrolase family protein [bacterium]
MPDEKPSLLLINACLDADDPCVPVYLAMLEPFFRVATVHVDALASPRFAEDAAVVTGSTKLITRDPAPEILYALYRETEKPLLGICYGHQTLAHAWGARVVKKEFFEADAEIRVSRPDALLDGLGKAFPAFKSHFEHVVADEGLTRHFDVSATSDWCAVEVIRHRARPLWGTQFHPERSGGTGELIAANFCRIVASAGSRSSA